ncbi:insulinase family protein [Micromonospora sp. NBC_01796]|uniref:insulinase family protein n=1 Tax=Micromonospora sp. NBC_01796 TaxID=2975987 RepID=UPI002DDB23AE|nr:insulinase family protein [Micromonospora sp. NBC_01796]WSA86749.1 insulinase family protein [Micromonospora sp. NBC_01796]
MIRQLEVDGVPTLLAPTDGPMQAGLAFRVGTADETLARSGVTHLLEHLALAPIGLADYHFNGATGPAVTRFQLQGSEQDIADFLAAVCRNLHDLPMQRLDLEKEILRTEWSSRSPGAMDSVPLWRHGARDHGLASYPEFGLSMLTPEHLRTWAGRYFTRENAVLWIAGARVPAGLRLPLPNGTRHPVPTPSSALPTTPAYFTSGSRAVALDAVVRRDTAAGVFAEVLERELFRSLRQEGGLSYTATAVYEPRDSEYATLRALADALPEKQWAVLGGFVDVLAKLKVGRIEQADLDAHVGKVTDALGSAAVHAARLPGFAFNLLVGAPNLTLEEYRAELKQVTVTDLHRVADEAMSSALLMVPDGCRADWAGFAEAPTRSTHALPGTSYTSIDGNGELRFGPDGVSYLGPGGPLSVPYTETAAMLAWPDGARQVIGLDGIGMRIEPTLFQLHPDTVRMLDHRIPVSLRVDMPARAPEAIPVPGPVQPVAKPPLRPYGWLAVVGLVLSGIATVGVGGFALLMTLGAFVTEEADAFIWGLVVFSWILTATVALPIFLIHRHRRRSQPTR